MSDADNIVTASLVSFLESQLCRSLRKKPAEVAAESVERHLALYAVVDKGSIHSVLLAAAMKTQST